MNIKNKKLNPYKVSCYEIYRNYKLGEGNYSEVFLARCLDEEKISKYKIIDGMVAVKKISMINFNSKTIKKIKDEMEIMQLIKNNPHSNIVGCYDIIDDIDTVYIVMEYCVDGDLSKNLDYSMNEKIVKSYFSQIVNGLIYLSNNNIIHRDIKPKNILLTNDKKTIKLCDFGLAKIMTGLTRMNTICGSPLYMAPEILNQKNYTNTIDIWSIGIILFEMIFGYHPMVQCKDIEELKNYINENEIAIPPDNFNGTISVECVNILKLLLQKSDKDRINIQNILKHKWFNEVEILNENYINNNIEQDNNEIFEFEY